MLMIILILEFLLPFFLSGSPAQQSSSGLKLKSYSALCHGFNLLFPNRNEFEENQLKLMGVVSVIQFKTIIYKLVIDHS